MYVLILALDLFQELKCSFFIINRNRRTHIYSREYYIAAKSTTWKSASNKEFFTVGSLPSELEPVNS